MRLRFAECCSTPTVRLVGDPPVYMCFVVCVERVGSIPPGCAGLVWFMLFKATFNNISVISWRSVLLAEETGVPGENHRPVASH